MMKSKHELRGVLPVFQTPWHEDETLDLETLEREIAWLHDCGAQGIVMAMVSETLRLDSEEREQLAEAACKLGRARGVVVISVGAESSKVAERYARHAESVGADAVMAIPPVSVGIGEGELLAYYRRIIEAIRIPVIVQDASGYVGKPMPIAMQARLLDEFGPERVLYKPEASPIGPKLSELRDATGGRARVFEGTGGIALDTEQKLRADKKPLHGALDAHVEAAFGAAGREERHHRLHISSGRGPAIRAALHRRDDLACAGFFFGRRCRAAHENPLARGS